MLIRIVSIVIIVTVPQASQEAGTIAGWLSPLVNTLFHMQDPSRPTVLRGQPAGRQAVAVVVVVVVVEVKAGVVVVVVVVVVEVEEVVVVVVGDPLYSKYSLMSSLMTLGAAVVEAYLQ